MVILAVNTLAVNTSAVTTLAVTTLAVHGALALYAVSRSLFVELATALVAEAPWSVRREWAVALRFDHPRATVLVLVLG